MARIYYVAAHISDASVDYLRTLCGPTTRHITLVYSKEWFPYKVNKAYPIVVLADDFRKFGDLTVLAVHQILLTRRHEEIRKAGATWDYEGYIPHITLHTRNPNLSISNIPPGPIYLDYEYYGTWDEKEKG